MTGIRLDGRWERLVVGDRVKTMTGRIGRIKKTWSDEAVVLWDDGEVFAIKMVHLSLVDEDLAAQ